MVTCTSPLPILLGYLTGRNDANNVAAYSNTNSATFANTTFVNRLALQNPVPYSLASDMYGNAGRKAFALARASTCTPLATERAIAKFISMALRRFIAFTITAKASVKE